MLAKIYRPARNAMQSGNAKSQDWLLEFESETPRTVDPLMGWISNADTNSQLRMYFETREEAIEFAKREGIPFQVTEGASPSASSRPTPTTSPPGEDVPGRTRGGPKGDSRSPTGTRIIRLAAIDPVAQLDRAPAF